MDQNTLEILLKADQPDDVISPPNFDWLSATDRVRQVWFELIDLTRLQFEYYELQDSYHFAQLTIRCPKREPQGNYGSLITIDFSSFGYFFTIWSLCSAESLSSGVISKIRETISKRGFVYVDHEDLEEQYSGSNSAFKGKSWGLRFFGWP
jgi:hypothetical protein